MSRKFKLVLIGLAVLLLVTGCAQQNKVAVVNMQQIVEESDHIQSYQQQLDNKLKELQTEYESKLKDIDGEDELNKKREEAYQKSEEIKSNIESKVKQDIQQAINKVASNNEIDVVLKKNNVKYGGTDITDKVIKILQE